VHCLTTGNTQHALPATIHANRSPKDPSPAAPFPSLSHLLLPMTTRALALQLHAERALVAGETPS
jgi:hypothetical protein